MTPLEAAKLAQSAYTDAPTIGKADSAARAVVYGSSLAFPGTDNAACFLSDIDAVADHVPSLGRLHTGFWNAFAEMAPEIIKLDGIERTVGHSLGAALAILCAAELCIAGKPPKEVWAFEPPRVSCDVTLATLLEDHGVKLNLYRNGLDVVTQVPRLLENWQHCAPLIPIGSATMPFDNIMDHQMARVIAALS